MDQRLTIITLAVKDLNRSSAFYLEKFGWTPKPMESKDIYFFQLNGILLALYPIEKCGEDTGVEMSDGGYHPLTLAYKTRSEDEVDHIFSDLEKKGVTIVKYPEKVFWGGYSGYVSDPDGNLWEIAFSPYLHMDGLGNAID